MQTRYYLIQKTIQNVKKLPTSKNQPTRTEMLPARGAGIRALSNTPLKFPSFPGLGDNSLTIIYTVYKEIFRCFEHVSWGLQDFGQGGKQVSKNCTVQKQCPLWTENERIALVQQKKDDVKVRRTVRSLFSNGIGGITDRLNYIYSHSASYFLSQ